MAYFKYQNWLFSQWASEQAGNGGFVCGTGIFALLATCIAAGGILSAAGSLLGLIGYVRAEKPRPRKRLLEVLIVGSALVIAIVAGLVLG